MLCEGKESQGWATDVAAQSGRKAIILHIIAVQCFGTTSFIPASPSTAVSISLIRKDKKITELFPSSEVWFYADCGHDDDLKGVKKRRSLIVVISKFIAIFPTCLHCQM